MIPVPQKLLEQGLLDLVRVSDSRMSGTSWNRCCTLHPEAAAGAIKDAGSRRRYDRELNVPERRIDLLVAPAELNAAKCGNCRAAPTLTRVSLGCTSTMSCRQMRGRDFDSMSAQRCRIEFCTATCGTVGKSTPYDKVTASPANMLSLRVGRVLYICPPAKLMIAERSTTLADASAKLSRVEAHRRSRLRIAAEADA